MSYKGYFLWYLLLTSASFRRFITSSFWFSLTPPFLIIVLFVPFLYYVSILDGYGKTLGEEQVMFLVKILAIGAPLSFFVFLPPIIARTRYHPKLRRIFYMNLFLFWTGVGWLGVMGIAIGKVLPKWDQRLDPTSETVSISVADELEKLVSMKEKGLLTDQEFSDAKEKLLS